MKAPVLIFILAIILVNFQHTHALIKLITTMIRDNVNGHPSVHQIQHWPFKPDEGTRRNPEFEALHGHRSYDLIERLGLGVDGRQSERKHQQSIRDLGVPTTSYDPTPTPMSADLPDPSIYNHLL